MYTVRVHLVARLVFRRLLSSGLFHFCCYYVLNHSTSVFGAQFYGVMTAVYAIYGIIWIIAMMCSYKDLIRLQVYHETDSPAPSSLSL